MRLKRPATQKENKKERESKPQKGREHISKAGKHLVQSTQTCNTSPDVSRPRSGWRRLISLTGSLAHCFRCASWRLAARRFVQAKEPARSREVSGLMKVAGEIQLLSAGPERGGDANLA